MQSVGDAHETALRVLEVMLESFGIRCSDQSRPFQRSAIGWLVYGDAVVPPTAMHAVLEVHDTPVKLLPYDGTLGVA